MKIKVGLTLVGFCMMATFASVAQATLLEGYVATMSPSGLVFTAITIPGSSVSVALDGLNNAGVLVGCSEASNEGCTSGLIDTAGVFTTVNYPGASYTALNAINSVGHIVGQYYAASALHGLLDAGGALTTIDFPGPSFTVPRGINDSGEIVGELYSSGYIQVGGSFTTVDVPGANYTILGGINNSGQVVGTYAPGGPVFGFLDSGGKFTSFSVPGSTVTFANAINDDGEIVGTFINASGGVHGFLYQNGVFTVLNYPGAVDTWAQGINDKGEIVGYFQTAVPEPSSLLLLLLGLSAGACARRFH